ncbi:MAG: ComEC/Rec2 family competence protein [Flavobacteriales bacterium]|nr:ComEC/Rec2 family competence protein [Flavobacteriales bacterium]
MSASGSTPASDLISAFVRAPLMRACLPFMAGLSVAFATKPSIGMLWGAVACASVIFLWLVWRRTVYERRWQRGLAFSVLLVALGALWGVLRDPRRPPSHALLSDARVDGLLVRIDEVTGSSERTVKAFAVVEAVRMDSAVISASGTVVLTLFDRARAPLLLAGERLWVERAPVPLDRIADPGGFDPAAWAATHGAAHEVFAGAGQWCRIDAPGPLASAVQAMRTRTLGWIEASGMDRTERGLVKALLLGIRDELDAEQKVAFARSGTIHVLAVSGMHVGLVYAVFMAMLGWWGRKPRTRLLRAAFILLVLWGYAGLTGWSPSVLRATVMFSFFVVAEVAERQAEPLNSLFGAALLLLLWDPLMLVQLSFQLSFLAVLGIILFYKPIQRLWYPPGRVLHYFWSLAAVSIAAQLITTPLSLYLFKAFPVWFLPANLVIVGLVSICVYAGGLMVLLHAVPFVGPALTWVNVQLVHLLGACSSFFAELPFAYPAVRVDGFQMVLLYLLLAFAGALFFWRWRPARAGALATVLLLLVTWGLAARQRNAQRAVVVYAERDRLSLAVVVGRRMQVIADTVDTYLERKVDLHARAVGADEVRWARTGEEAMQLSLPGIPAVQLVPPGRFTVPLDSTAVAVLHGDGRYDLEGLKAVRRVVLAPDMPHRRRNFLRRWCVENGVACHDVDRAGAAILGP